MRSVISPAALGLLLVLTTVVFPAQAAEPMTSAGWKNKIDNEDDIDKLGKLYIDFLVETDPGYGTVLGIHGRDDNPRFYDDRLGHVSPGSWSQRLRGNQHMLERLARIDPTELSWDDRVDYRILKKRIQLRSIEITELGGPKDPLTYITGRNNTFSGLGASFSRLLMRDYAPLLRRLQSFGVRCRQVPRFLDETRATLSSPGVYPTAVNKQVALTRLQGMTGENGLFRKSLPEAMVTIELPAATKQSLTEACDKAVASLEEFTAWFEETIVPRKDGEWRIGKPLYEKKYSVYMDYPLTPDQLLASAEADLEKVRAELVAVGRKIHDDYLADETAAGKVEKAAGLSDGDVVRNVFAKVSEDRSTSETLIADSYALADTIVDFVKSKDLMDLPPTSKLRIEDIPPFLSGYAVAQIITAPPFEPELQSVWYWDLALLATAEDFLKEYNRPALALVYIHEGVPGHFVQLEYSNALKRIMPRVFKNNAMVEGWATYIATQLVEQGFTIYPDSPYGQDIQKMVDRKLVLRSLINTIIDIRLHTSDWSEEDAVAMMIKKGFQESGEANGKLARAKQSSVQLASYYAGHRAILELLEAYKEKQGDDFSWKEFNERLVTAGSPPFFALKMRMLGEE
jgi:uncharacterized protein (DUF885 family)